MTPREKCGARDVALDALMQVDKANAWSDEALRRLIAQNRLDSRDAAFATRLCYGVMQNRMLLDYYIGCWCAQKPERLEPVIRGILRIGGYQILFMDKVPHRAAVNEAVEMTRRRGRPKAAGMVNAVLRRFVEHWMNMPDLPKGSTADYLSLRYSHPKWLVLRLLDLVGPDETQAFLRLDNDTVPTCIQVNPLRTTAEELERELRGAGVAVQPHPWLEGCLEITGTGDLRSMPAFREGRFLVQDAAARLAAMAAAAAPGDRVLDVCAAPGGKSFTMAMDMGDRGQILSCDVHPYKVKLIESGAKRLGLTCIRTTTADARENHAAWRQQADVVMADVPCSGLGIIRKKPDIRYKSPKELAQLPLIQRAILENAASYVRPGGTLVYSTCTILPEENEGVSDSFLAEHPDFCRTPFSLSGPVGETEGQVTLWPHRHGTDGFYICRMKRT